MARPADDFCFWLPDAGPRTWLRDSGPRTLSPDVGVIPAGART